MNLAKDPIGWTRLPAWLAPGLMPRPFVRMVPRLAMGLMIAAIGLLLSGCELSMVALHAGKTLHQKDKGKAAKGKTTTIPKQKIGKPYTVNGVWYYPGKDPNYNRTGIASWYGRPFHGRQTANGETYDMNDLTAAHKTLPLPSNVEVTNLENGRTIVLRVNDRGPFVQGRIIDVSRRAAQLLGFANNGVAKVRVRLVGAAQRRTAAKPKLAPLLAVPKSEVSAVVLSAPVGAKTRRKKNLTKTRNGTRVANAPARRTTLSDTKTGQGVRRVKANPGELFIQAGAFRQFHFANRLRVRLSSFGLTRISKIQINGDEIFRVRVGPITDVPQADQVLQNVINEGYSDARIIVD